MQRFDTSHELKIAHRQRKRDSQIHFALAARAAARGQHGGSSHAPDFQMVYEFPTELSGLGNHDLITLTALHARRYDGRQIGLIGNDKRDAWPPRR